MRIKRRKSRKSRKIKGGSSAFVGRSLNYSNIGTWPGVQVHGGNHYSLNPQNTNVFPITSSMRGGYVYENSKKRKHTRRKSRRWKSQRQYVGIGGGVLPILSDARNFFNGGIDTANNALRTLGGYPQSSPASPYQGQFAKLLH